MLRQRGPISSAPSKASSQTLCQKCLKRGHYSYECKSSTQERPYVSRPSRSQQLTNPKLLPPLTSDVPNDLLRKKGVADEELAKKEVERGRKRKLEEDGYSNGSRKRSRSSASYSSISTISTISRSLSPGITDKGATGQSQLMSGLHVSGKRRRRSQSSSIPYTSDSENSMKKNGSKYRRSGPLSPVPFDRPKLKDVWEQDGGQSYLPRSRRRSRSLSVTSDSSNIRMSRRRSSERDGGGKRRRRASRSPDDRGRERHSEGPRQTTRRYHSPSESRDRSEVTRHRKSMTPGQLPKPNNVTRGDASSGRRRSSYDEDHDLYGSIARPTNGNVRQQVRTSENRPPLPRKRRSLSPFSKRLALTQAMNMGK